MNASSESTSATCSHSVLATVAQPTLIAFNEALAGELGITGADDPRLAPVFAGNVLPEGAEPWQRAAFAEARAAFVSEDVATLRVS